MVRRMYSLSLSQSGMAMQKAAEARRGKGQVGFEQPLELGQRFVVEGDVVELLGLRPASSRQ